MDLLIILLALLVLLLNSISEWGRRHWVTEPMIALLAGIGGTVVLWCHRGLHDLLSARGEASGRTFRFIAACERRRFHVGHVLHRMKATPLARALHRRQATSF